MTALAGSPSLSLGSVSNRSEMWEEDANRAVNLGRDDKIYLSVSRQDVREQINTEQRQRGEQTWLSSVMS